MAFERAEMRMVRWVCGVKLRDRVPRKGLRERLGLDDIISVLNSKTGCNGMGMSCFFCYRLTQVVPDRVQRAVKRLSVCVWGRHQISWLAYPVAWNHTQWLGSYPVAKHKTKNSILLIHYIHLMVSFSGQPE